MLYDQGLPEIQDLTDLQNEIKSSSIDSEWCPNSVKIESLIQDTENVSSPELAAVGPQDHPPDKNAPQELPAYQAVDWPEGHLNVDVRPHHTSRDLSHEVRVDVVPSEV